MTSILHSARILKRSVSAKFTASAIFMVLYLSSLSAAVGEQASSSQIASGTRRWYLMGAIGFNSGFRGRNFIPYSSNKQNISTNYTPELSTFIFQEMTADLALYPFTFLNSFVRDLGFSLGYGLYTSKLYVSPADCQNLPSSITCSAEKGRFIFASFKANRNIGLIYRWPVFRDFTQGLPFDFDIQTNLGWHFSNAHADPEMKAIYANFNSDQVLNSWYSSVILTFTPRDFPYILLGVGAEYRAAMIDVGDVGLYIRPNDFLFRLFIAGMY